MLQCSTCIDFAIAAAEPVQLSCEGHAPHANSASQPNSASQSLDALSWMSMVGNQNFHWSISCFSQISFLLGINRLQNRDLGHNPTWMSLLSLVL